MAGGRTQGAGREIELDLEADGSKAAAYHVVPAAGRGRGVLVLGEGDPGDPGDAARDACDRLARGGFVALALHGAAPADPAAWLRAGAQHLLGDTATDGSGVGLLGFGRGGALALAAAARVPRIRCVVDFYGLPEAEAAEEPDPCELPALLVFGAEDPRAAGGAAQALAERLPRARLLLQPDAGSGFMDATRPDRHAAPAAAAGWDAALAFLGASL